MDEYAIFRRFVRGAWTTAWVAAAFYEVCILLFSADKARALTPFVIGYLTSHAWAAFAAGAVVAHYALAYHDWLPWPRPPWWGIAVVVGTTAGLAIIELTGGKPAPVPFTASGAFGTLVGHLFWAKCVDEHGNLTDCEHAPGAGRGEEEDSRSPRPPPAAPGAPRPA